MRIAICDDDEIIVHQIRKIITDFFEMRKLAVPQIDIFYSGDSLLNDTHKKDIVFLDIEMPGLDGIGTGKKLLDMNKNTILIMVTSYSEYLDDAMRINVFRYISKPIDRKRLERNLNDAIGSYNARTTKSLTVNTDTGVIKCMSSEIVMLEMVERKVKLYTEKDSFFTDKTLTQWLNILPDTLFYQCHRSYIVNIAHINRITADKVIMDVNGLEAYLTLRKHTDMKRKWMMYLESLY